MSDEQLEGASLKDVVVRICLSCGVVNPAQPAETCPHVQLARFKGIDESLAGLLADVAAARREYAARTAELKERVKLALRNHEADIEIWAKPRKSEKPCPSPARALKLESPALPARRNRQAERRMPRTIPSPRVDPRQLELIIREPPKGDA